MVKVQMIAIDGLDSAVIGTGYRDGNEVLAYNGDLALALAHQMGFEVEYLEEFLEIIGAHELGEYAPVFVFLDAEVAEEVERAKRDHRSLH